MQTTIEIADEYFIPTGPDQFQRYGFPLSACDHRYYPYSEATSEPSPEILCCHMLAVDPDAQTQSYYLLLLSHADTDHGELRARATRYSVGDVADNLYTYLDTSGVQRTSRLPEWEDFQELVEEYEVML